jgi:hypothetical protein
MIFREIRDDDSADIFAVGFSVHENVVTRDPRKPADYEKDTVGKPFET